MTRAPLRLALAALILVLVAMLPEQASAADALVRTERADDDVAWTGGRIPISVELLAVGTFDGAPVFDLPDLERTLIVRVGRRPLLGTRTLDGTSYTTQRHQLALVTQRDGSLELPSFDVRFRSVPAFGQDPVEHRLSTEPLLITVRRPPGMEGLAMVVSAPDLSLQETWSPSPGPCAVGDAFRRTLRWETEGLPGMLLPPLPLGEPEGLGLYRDPPELEDETERGAFRGLRTDRVTYVVERPGERSLPALAVRWWDTDDEVVRRIELPGVTFKAEAVPTQAAAEAPRSAGPPWDWIVGLGLTGLLLALLARTVGRPIAGHLRRQLERRRRSEPGRFRELERAAHTGDPRATLAALHSWLDGAGGRRSQSLQESGLLDQADSAEPLTDLLDAILDDSVTWDAQALLRGMARYRPHQHRASERSSLPALNPPLAPLERRASAMGHAPPFHRPLAPVTLAALLLNLACTVVGPEYVAPEVDLPDAWNAELSQGLDDGSANLHTWWSTLQDPMLEDLVQRAAANNQDLESAFYRILQARALRGVATGARYPDLDAAGSWQRFRLSEGVSGVTIPPLSRTDDLTSIGADATWELDVFGRIQRSIESADADLQASVEDYRDTLVLLFSDVATTYVQARSLQARIAYVAENVEAQRGTLQLTRDRVQAEISPLLDVRQAELNLARTESALPTLREALARAVHRLGVLVGEHPGSLWQQFQQQGAIPAPSSIVGMDIPLDVVRQRPDLRRAERSLAAQTARIGVQEANLYPRFALAGSFAYTAKSDVLDADNQAWSVGPLVRWNLFDGGRVRNAIHFEDARTEEALVRYEQAVLLALEEVENALVAYHEERQRRAMLERSVTAATESVELVKTLYVNGLTNFQNVLDMEQALTAQQDAMAESEGLVIVNLVRLYKALGGGWGGNAVVDAELQDQQDGEPTF
jgi:NodT family efflux transporter outer membrane factor (OMF) lipoprotein